MSLKYLLVFSLAMVALTTPSLADYPKPPNPIGKPPKGGVKPPAEYKPPTAIGLPPKGERSPPEYNPPKPIGKPKGEKPPPTPVGRPPKGEKPLPEHKLPTPVGIPPKGEKPPPEHKPPMHDHYPRHPSVANAEDLHKPPRKVMPQTPLKKPLAPRMPPHKRPSHPHFD
ncbi:early nodulin-75-like [Actinidia eriantha]|uniref:early nodulin-75-like n=1 Tax=Actinidia eriantha TaxID=165200 RepID=UPI00258EDF12|nr:early nodulin-75-like [Actinidia eriantha]